MQQTNNNLSMWEAIISEVHKTDVPLECIKKVVIKLTNRKQRTINLAVLRKQGVSGDELERVVNSIMSEFEDQVRDIDFVVDVNAVAEIVQPETDALLKRLKS